MKIRINGKKLNNWVDSLSDEEAQFQFLSGVIYVYVASCLEDIAEKGGQPDSTMILDIFDNVKQGVKKASESGGIFEVDSVDIKST